MTEASRAIRDVGHLLWFRSAATRRRRTSRWGLLIVAVITAGAAFGPAFLGDYRTSQRVTDVSIVIPSALAAFLLLSLVSGIASGGGRELISRDQAVAFPVSPTSDHLGALLLSPLNVAWMVQVWFLLGATAFAIGGTGALLPAQLVIMFWVLAATAAAQIVAWSAEAVRRGPAGLAIVRTVGALGMAIAGWLFFTGQFGDFLDALPTVRIVKAMVAPAEGNWSLWAGTVAVLLVMIPVLVALGGVSAHLAARRHPRDELRIESETRTPRPASRSDFFALLRVDRASVWRVVPMRRGIMVLAIGPGLVGVAGGLDWPQLTILPGLVASGGALLFGVNAWCLEARGVLWRESLPVNPATVFDARVVVLMEFLLLSSGFTIVLASLRAGVPSAQELAAILSTWLVVTMQVVSASMRWSAKRPFAVDLRSARATPAPPAVMVGYSSRLAVSTTLTSLIFSGLARLPVWQLAVLIAIPFLAVSTGRVLKSRAVWLNPAERVRIVSTVAG